MRFPHARFIKLGGEFLGYQILAKFGDRFCKFFTKLHSKYIRLFWYFFENYVVSIHQYACKPCCIMI